MLDAVEDVFQPRQWVLLHVVPGRQTRAGQAAVGDIADVLLHVGDEPVSPADARADLDDYAVAPLERRVEDETDKVTLQDTPALAAHVDGDDVFRILPPARGEVHVTLDEE